MKTFILTALALIAFAANSVLCRLALENNAIDASSFTMIRLFSGAAVLLLFFDLIAAVLVLLQKEVGYRALCFFYMRSPFRMPIKL